MNDLSDFTFLSAGACGCCENGLEAKQSSYDCSRRATVFTEREEQVLRRIRELNGRARELKWQLQHLSAARPEQSPERMRVLHEFEGIRQVRAELERERLAAAEERMRLLGHI